MTVVAMTLTVMPAATMALTTWCFIAWSGSLLAGPRLFVTLAQSAESVGEATRQVLWAVLALIGAIALVIVAALAVRRWVLRAPDQAVSRGFTLADLRRLHEAGELSDAEWEAARRAMLARGKREHLGGDADPPDDAGAKGQGPPSKQ